MAERKSGAVKPPTIDLTARDAADEARQDTNSSERPSEAPRPQARLAMPWSAIAIAAVGGAVLGTIVTYSLAGFLPLPDNRQQIADPSARLDNLDATASGLDDRLTTLEKQARNTQVSLDATITQLDTGLSGVEKSISELQAAPAPVDLAPLQAQIKALQDRVAMTASGATGSEATALAETLSATQNGLDQVREQLATLEDSVARQQASLDAQTKALDTVQATVSSQANGTGAMSPVVRLPLLTAAFESAAANGRPYAAELSAITALLPDLTVPDAVSAAAATGLPRPDTVVAEARAAIPAILAGRAGAGSGDLSQDALEWVKGVLAVRPTDETTGDAPEALVSRFEAALNRRDFAAAADLLGQLPPAMKAAAGTVSDDISALAAADGFIAAVQAQALGATS